MWISDHCAEKKITVYSLIFLMIVSGISSAHSDPITSGHQKFLGNVISSTPPTDFSKYWNQVTPENSGKWGFIERTRSVMSWETIQKAYDFAKQSGYPFKQHTFVWGQQEPDWIKDLSPEEQKTELEEYIRLYGEKFPETDFADVVNEPLNAPASYREALGGAGTTGWDWVIWAFQKAREYLPNTKLLLNEWGVINDDAMTDRYLQIINLLKERNLIDGIGEQSHCFSFQGSNDTTPDIDPEIIKGNLDKLAATGLPIYISELDLQGDDALQLQRYQRYFPVLWAHPAVKGVTLWGYRYNRTWIETTWLQDSTGKDRPALKWLQEYVTSASNSISQELDKNRNASSPFFIHGNAIEITGKNPVFLELFTLNGKKIRSITTRSSLPLSYFDIHDGCYIIRANSIHVTKVKVKNKP
jgi:endo-1,4-beta-xylanase